MYGYSIFLILTVRGSVGHHIHQILLDTGKNRVPDIRTSFGFDLSTRTYMGKRVLPRLFSIPSKTLGRVTLEYLTTEM